MICEFPQLACNRWRHEVDTCRTDVEEKYVAFYKGRLYCPTPHCQAKLSYNSAKKGHYKTWRNNNHSSACLYNLERDGVRYIGSADLKLDVKLRKTHKQNALIRAYKSMVINEPKPSNVEQVITDIKTIRQRRGKEKSS